MKHKLGVFALCNFNSTNVCLSFRVNILKRNQALNFWAISCNSTPCEHGLRFLESHWSARGVVILANISSKANFSSKFNHFCLTNSDHIDNTIIALLLIAKIIEKKTIRNNYISCPLTFMQARYSHCIQSSLFYSPPPQFYTYAIWQYLFCDPIFY